MPSNGCQAPVAAEPGEAALETSPAASRPAPGDQNQGPVVAERQVADLDVAGLGHGTLGAIAAQ